MVAVKYSTPFAGLMKTVTPAVIATLELPVLCVFETPTDVVTRLVSFREFRPLGEDWTGFTYRLETVLSHGGIARAVGAALLKALYRPRFHGNSRPSSAWSRRRRPRARKRTVSGRPLSDARIARRTCCSLVRLHRRPAASSAMHRSPMVERRRPACASHA